MTDDYLAERVHDVAELIPLVPGHRKVLEAPTPSGVGASTRHEKEPQP